MEALQRRAQLGTHNAKWIVLRELKVCSKTKNLQRGKEIHLEVMESENASCIYFGSALVNMYAKCQSMTAARRVFDGIDRPDVVSWTALILGYADNGDGLTALDLFARMQSKGCTPDAFTFVAALKACTCLALDKNVNRRAECLMRGKKIHSQIGVHLDMHVQNSLINMYAKCGSLAQSRQVFESIKHPNVVSWNALISGYADNGEGAEALELFARMKSQGCVPNSLTFVTALKACGLTGALEWGKRIHKDMKTELNATLVTCLVDFYGKCGDMVTSRKVFDLHPRTRDVTTWTALLAGYTGVRDNQSVFSLVEGMQDAGLQPNGVTFLCVLMCCSHAGLVNKGMNYLEEMSTRYGLTPTVEHYTSLIDMLVRSNKLDDAIALLQSMPCTPNSVTWMTVLAACRKWKNVGVGGLAFQSLVSFGDRNAAAYMLMASIYESRGMWKEQKMVFAMRNVLKDFQTDQTFWTTGDGEVHKF